MTFDDNLRMLIREETAKVIHDVVPEIAAAVATKLGRTIAPEEYVSVRRAAKIADYTPDTIRDLVRAGKLKRYGEGRLRIKVSELHACMERKRKNETTALNDDDIRERVDKVVARLVR